MTIDKRLIIVEDKEDEAEKALQTAQNIFERNNIVIVNTLYDYYSETLQKRFDYVLTDLFFPVGNTKLEKELESEIREMYQSYANSKCPLIPEDNPVLLAINVVAETLQISPKDYLENYLKKLNTPQIVLSSAYDAINGRENFQTYNKLHKIIEKITEGSNFPSGYFVVKYANLKNSKCVIVTSTYHHDLSFEPLNGHLKCKYIDYLDEDGKKSWEKGLEMLMN